MNPTPQKTDAITFAVHGSRLPEANAFIARLIATLSTDVPINLGYLEMAEPNIAAAIVHHIQSGKNQIRIIPLFLVPGKHTTQDIPAIVLSLSQQYPDCQMTIDAFIGEHPQFAKLLSDLLY